VGIPVVMVAGPTHGRWPVAGKGIDLASARASGLMEATELYQCRDHHPAAALAAYEELRYQHNVVEIDDLPHGFDSRFHPFLRLLWCEGRDLLGGGTCCAFELGSHELYGAIARMAMLFRS